MSERRNQPHADMRSYSFVGSWCLTCAAVFALSAVLLFTIIFFVLRIPAGLADVTWRSLTIAVVHSIVLPITIYVANLVRLLFPWPLFIIVLLIIAVRVWGPDRIQEWLSSSKLNIAGVLTYEGTSAEIFSKELGYVQGIVSRGNRWLAEVYKSALPYAVQLRERHGLSGETAILTRDVVALIGERCPSDFRLAIHIPDFVFGDRLYQLTEYFDKTGEQMTPDKAGRSFSIRYGIIGRVWRSGVPEIEGELISAEDRTLLGDDYTPAELDKFIARRWGLTLQEAVFVRPYNSYGAIRVECGGQPVGLLYFDSKKRNAFAEQNQLQELQLKIQALVLQSPFAIKMLELHRETEGLPRVRIYPR